MTLIKKRIMVVTTGRADYGLLSPLLTEMENSQHCDLLLVVTGMHLSKLHGHTVDAIIADGRPITGLVPMNLEADDPRSLCQAMAEGIAGFGELFSRVSPDLVVVLGDRYELWSICTAAVLHRIPIAHIHGGESTLGLVDDFVRHSVSKMAILHLVSLPHYARRIAQMGENPDNIHVVGAIGLDNIRMIAPMSSDELSASTGIDFSGTGVALFTFHPVTQDKSEEAGTQVRLVLESILDATELTILATMPNSDAGGKTIYNELVRFAEKNPKRIIIIKSLGQRRYLSTLQHACLMVGNSSSGIIEAASFQLPVVNIGDRQGGRFKPANIIDCACERRALVDALAKAVSTSFRDAVSNLVNPYGDGYAARRITHILEKFDVCDRAAVLKKGFRDIDIPHPWHHEDVV